MMHTGDWISSYPRGTHVYFTTSSVRSKKTTATDIFIHETIILHSTARDFWNVINLVQEEVTQEEVRWAKGILLRSLTQAEQSQHETPGHPHSLMHWRWHAHRKPRTALSESYDTPAAQNFSRTHVSLTSLLRILLWELLLLPSTTILWEILVIINRWMEMLV